MDECKALGNGVRHFELRLRARLLHRVPRHGRARQKLLKITQHFLEPSLRFRKGGAEGPDMIGRERTGILSTNHMRAFNTSFSKAETGFKRILNPPRCLSQMPPCDVLSSVARPDSQGSTPTAVTMTLRASAAAPSVYCPGLWGTACRILISTSQDAI